MVSSLAENFCPVFSPLVCLLDSIFTYLGEKPAAPLMTMAMLHRRVTAMPESYFLYFFKNSSGCKGCKRTNPSI